MASRGIKSEKSTINKSYSAVTVPSCKKDLKYQKILSDFIDWRAIDNACTILAQFWQYWQRWVVNNIDYVYNVYKYPLYRGNDKQKWVNSYLLWKFALTNF